MGVQVLVEVGQVMFAGLDILFPPVVSGRVAVIIKQEDVRYIRVVHQQAQTVVLGVGNTLGKQIAVVGIGEVVSGSVIDHGDGYTGRRVLADLLQCLERHLAPVQCGDTDPDRGSRAMSTTCPNHCFLTT